MAWHGRSGKTTLCLDCRTLKCYSCGERYESESGKTKLCPDCRPDHQKLTPLLCLACGCEFQSASGRSKLCLDCRDSKAACETCGGVFETNGKTYRCTTATSVLVGSQNQPFFICF
jgi:hypothetical protein